MNLHMFGVTIKKGILTKEVDFEDELEFQLKFIHYIHFWMDDCATHRWMEDLYRKKGGSFEFNGLVVKLTEEDLKDLRSHIEQCEEFISKARKAIENGCDVYYTGCKMF